GRLRAAWGRAGHQRAIARGSALARLGSSPSPAAGGVARAGLNGPDPLVRRAAAGALEGAELARRVELLAPLLDDPVRAVRMQAARALAGAPRERLTEAQRKALDRGLAEYVAAEQ